MDFIIDLVNIINRRKLQNIEILDKSLLSGKGSLFSNFYTGIEQNKINNERDAILFLYGDINDNEIKNFRQFKSRFRRRLINTLFFLDVNSNDYETSVQKYYFECLKSIQVINIIQKYGGNQRVAYHIIKDYYPIAMKYEFYDILHQYTFQMITYYSLRGDKDRLDKVIEDYNQFKAISDEEALAFVLFSEINATFASLKQPDLDYIECKTKQIDQLAQKSQSSIVKSYAYICKLLFLEYRLCINEVMDICDEMLLHVEQKDNAYRQSFRGIASMFKIRAYLQQRNFDQGIDYIDKHKNSFFGINQLEAQALKLKLALNLKDIQLAEKILKEVSTLKIFTGAPENIKEKWLIYEGYIDFYRSYIYGHPFKFNVLKLINEVPLHYHDKSGYNFSIIILQILFLIAKKDIENASQKINNLRIYKTRYFKDPKYNRTQEFIKQLLLIDKNILNKNNLTSPDLCHASTTFDGYIHEHEIIFYETILKIIMKLMEKPS